MSRTLKNPITTAFIDLDRIDYGARASISYPAALGSLTQHLTAGIDFQRQRDDRKNFNYLNSPGDSAKADTTRSLDQLEHVTEFGPFVQSALELSSKTTITAGVLVIGGYVFAQLMSAHGESRAAIEPMWEQSVVTVCLIAAGVAALLSVGLGVFLAWRVSRPLASLGAAARRVAGGDYAARVSRAGPRELASVAD